MPDGFKIGEAFVEVNAEVNKSQVASAVRSAGAAAEPEGRALGSRLGSGIGAGIAGGMAAKTGIIGSTIGAMATRLGVFAVAGAGAIAIAQQLTGVIGLLPAAGVAGGLAFGALKIGMSGFGDAMKNAGDPAKFAESLKSLAPAAQQTAIALRDQRSAWDDLKMSVQGNLFQGMAGTITGLANTYLPLLKTSLSGVAASMNATFQGIAADLMTVQRQADMRTVLGHSGAAAGNFVAALRPIISVFMDLAVVGAPILNQLSVSALGLAERFAAFVTKARETGQLQSWIMGGLQAVRDLWTIMSLVTGAVMDLVAALGGPSTLLGVLTLVAQALSVVAGFIRENITWIGPLAMAIGGMTVAIKLVTAATTAFRIASMLLFTTNPWMLVIGAIVAVVALIIMNWDKVKAFLAATWAAIKSAATTAWNAVTSAVGTAVRAAQAVVTAVVSAISSWWTMKLNSIKATASAVWNAITSAIGTAIRAAQAVVTAVVSAISSWWTSRMNSIKATASSIWNAIVSVVRGAINGVQSAISALGSLPGRIAGWFNSAKSAATNALGSLVSYVAGVPGRIVGALGNLGGLLVNSGRALIDGLGRGITSAFNAVKSKVSGMMSSLRNLFPFSPAKEGPFSGRGYTTYSGKALAGDFAKGIVSQQSAIQGAVSGMLGKVQPGFELGSLAGARAAGTAAMPVAAAGGVTIASLTLQVSGNLDPTNPVAWGQALESIRDGIRGLERSFT